MFLVCKKERKKEKETKKDMKTVWALPTYREDSDTAVREEIKGKVCAAGAEPS